MKVQKITVTQYQISIAYGNGQEFVGQFSDLPESIFVDCAASRHGIAQKLGDAKSGGSASEKFEEVQAIWEGLKKGEWNRKGDRGAGIEELMASVFQALAESAGQAKKAGAWLKQYQDLDDAGREEVRKKKAVKAMIDKIRAERKLATNSEEFNPFA
jgi:hypothetical protein